MASTDQELVDELDSRVETLTLDDAVRLVETNHPNGGPGVEREVFESYLDATEYGEDAFTSSLEESLTDADSWQGGGRVYDLGGGRVSAYPRRWHDELGDTTDLREYLRVIGDDAQGSTGSERAAVTEDGVAEGMLLDAAAAIGGVDHEDTRDRLKTLRDEGEIEANPSQHPNPWLRLA
ncbi:hypothetical protein [Haladaptatus salinisoli]|uniref:hypothetical protein n=1 Tax=Haladaptatus salinisoli TaxID=2884876 RepID=UPI001D0AC373|nr:hypothetical protein [Haladaptatus salinisoli]